MKAAVIVALGLWIAVSVPLAGQVRDTTGDQSRSRQALLALDRYLETWNSRNAALWATSLHFPHVRPGAGAFEVSRTAEEYAAGVNFEQTLRTGWHHSEWVSREVLQVGEDKVHVAGSWERFTAAGQSQTTSAITYIVTNHGGRWGIQARFAAGTGTVDAAVAARNGAAAIATIDEYLRAWNSHDPAALSKAIHYPHVNITDGEVEVWSTAEALLAGPEPGRQRTWYRLRVDGAKVAQVTANGVNVTLTVNRLARDGRVLSSREALFLVALRDGVWKLQARSML
jgi:hypothetical protein